MIKINPVSNIHPKMKDGYKNVNNNYTNRSSCVFPLFISEINDVEIVFLNYWKIKNKIYNVTCNIRIHDEQGNLIKLFTLNISEEHYAISIKSILESSTNFKGIAIIEFISSENFGFTFPGVTAFYSSNLNYSGVHTAGRIKNPEEKKIPSEIIETNWNCKWGNGITPFFTIFNGSLQNKKTFIQVKILNSKNKLVISENIPLNLEEPYSNKFFFLDEIFDFNELKIDNDCFIEVKIPFSDFFPRMICGNFFRKDQFLEVTHSFENQKDNTDYLDEVTKESNEYRIPSINPIATNSDLNLELLFFPTNCIGNVFGKWRSGNFKETLTKSEESFDWQCGGRESNLKKIKIKNGNKIKALDITQGKIPVRINTNYIYKLNHSNSEFSTDIAAGQITEYFPPKRFTWGHGIVGKDYKTVIFLTSFSHDKNCRVESMGNLFLCIGKNKFESSHKIPMDSGIEINVNEILKDKFDLEQISFISWYYIQEKRTKLIGYWLSYSKTGKITGDHAF